jgi:hypothetical protein
MTGGAVSSSIHEVSRPTSDGAAKINTLIPMIRR